MKSASQLLIACTFSLGACASPLKLQNVAGSWTCPRVDGVCADIMTIDQGLGAGPVAVPTADGAVSRNPQKGSVVLASMPSHTPSAMPRRTPDQVARIVFAPSVDANGHYHGPREVFAVMTTGTWVTAPDPSAATPSTQIVRPRRGRQVDHDQTTATRAADDVLALSAAKAVEAADDH